MIPLAMGWGRRIADAAAARHRVIGGIAASMVLSLVVTPAPALLHRKDISTRV